MANYNPLQQRVASLNGSVVSGSQPDLSLIPQGLCQPKFHKLVAKVSEKEFSIFENIKPENHLSVPELSGSMSSTEGTRQPLGPALCSTTWQPRARYQVVLMEAKATFAQTTFQRAQWVREANWETLSSLHSIEPTGLKRYQEVKRLTSVFK